MKPEDDRDTHLAVADLNNRKRTMVVEVVDPQCAGSGRGGNAPKIRAARTQFDEMLGNGNFASLVGETVRVRGIGFFDRGGGSHKPTGRSKSRIELHPVLEIAFEDQ